VAGNHDLIAQRDRPTIIRFVNRTWQLPPGMSGAVVSPRFNVSSLIVRLITPVQSCGIAGTYQMRRCAVRDERIRI
jgi:hypothetical protein